MLYINILSFQHFLNARCDWNIFSTRIMTLINKIATGFTIKKPRLYFRRGFSHVKSYLLSESHFVY